MYFKEIKINIAEKSEQKNDKKTETNKLMPFQCSDMVLLSSIKLLVKEERRIGSEIIEHLFEIDRRSLFSTQGFQSLFDYCVRELGYSEGSAQRRVLATRALRNNPEAGMALKQGKVSVTTLALFQEAAQKAKKSESAAPKLESIFGLSKLQTEKKLFEMTGVNVKAGIEKKRQISSTQTQVTLTFTEEQIKKLELVKGRLAHRLKQHTYAELIELLAEMAIEKTTPKVPAKNRKGKNEKEETALINPTSPEKLTQKQEPIQQLKTISRCNSDKKSKLNTRYIPQTIRAKIWQKSGGKCEQCQSSYALQIDHKVPYSLSLNSGSENLRILCRACNLAEAKRWGIARPE